MAKEQKTVDQMLKKVVDGVKEIPNLVKENKGATIGAVVGYLATDLLKNNQEVVNAILGGLVGKVVDENQKEKKEEVL